MSKKHDRAEEIKKLRKEQLGVEEIEEKKDPNAKWKNVSRYDKYEDAKREKENLQHGGQIFVKIKRSRQFGKDEFVVKILK